MTREKCLLNYYFGLINALDQQFKTLKLHRNDDSNCYKVEYEHQEIKPNSTNYNKYVGR